MNSTLAQGLQNSQIPHCRAQLPMSALPRAESAIAHRFKAAGQAQAW